MADGGVRYTDDIPEDIEHHLREICLVLPDVSEERAWKGTRWVVRNKNFASVIGVERDAAGSFVALSFRSAGEELEILRQAGHPFFELGWGYDALGMVLDDTTDWNEVRELITESYCVVAPKKLIALVDRPPADDLADDLG